MKILFLDIDGVLNSARFFSGRPWDDHVEKFQTVSPTDIVMWAKMLDTDALMLLHDFVVAHKDVQIVVSSSWREVHPIARIRRIFNEAGSKHIAERIIDRTDVGTGGRASLINAWVERFVDEIDEWAALDDMPLEGLDGIHIRTTWADGLQQAHIERLRELFR